MGVKPKDASKAAKTASKNWNALTPAQRNKVRRDLALNVALATAPYGRAAKVVGKGVKAAVNKRATNKFMKDLKKNGVAVKLKHEEISQDAYDKAVATIRKQPWVNVVKMGVDPSNFSNTSKPSSGISFKVSSS